MLLMIFFLGFGFTAVNTHISPSPSPSPIALSFFRYPGLLLFTER